MDNLQIIPKYLDSREVAEMVEKEHRYLLRDIRRYVTQFNQCKIAPVDFFREDTYRDKKGEIRPCYQITKKGCEFIAHKLTGTKGTIFTARYINRFHEMEDIISEKNKVTELPWFIKKLNGKYFVLERDFAVMTGVDIQKHKLFYRPEYFQGGKDFNCGWNKEDEEKFFKKYGSDVYSEDRCIAYMYLCGVRKALDILKGDRKITVKPDAEKLLLDGIKVTESLEATKIHKISPNIKARYNSIVITIGLV